MPRLPQKPPSSSDARVTGLSASRAVAYEPPRVVVRLRRTGPAAYGSRPKALIERERPLVERINWQRVEAFLCRAHAASRPIDEAFVFSLHRLTLEGTVVREEDRGSYRDRRVVVRYQKRMWGRGAEPSDIDGAMGALLARVNWRGSTDVIEAAASAFLEFVRIHPFVQGNGRVARALATYILMREGFSHRIGMQLERYFDGNPAAYYSAIRRGLLGDVSAWQGLLREAVRVSALLAAPFTR